MRYRSGLLLIAFFVPLAPLAAADNELTDAEKKEGYILLFDGKDLSNFREEPKRKFNKWYIADGVLSLHRATYPTDPNFNPHPLWTKQEFQNYVLKVDFHTGPDPENGHSSLILRAAGPPTNYPQPALEASIYGPARKLGHFCTGAFRYQIQSPKSVQMKPAGEWNSYVITFNHPKVTVELNGTVVNQLDLSQWTEKGKRPDGSGHPLPLALSALPAKSPIGFRDDYGIPIWYKNIKIKPLATETKE